MARPEKLSLEVKPAVDVGRAENVFRFRDKFVQVHGTFVATLQLEGTLNGSDYFAVGSPVTAPAVIAVPQTVEFLRVRTTAFTSGAPHALFGGFDERAT